MSERTQDHAGVDHLERGAGSAPGSESALGAAPVSVALRLVVDTGGSSRRQAPPLPHRPRRGASRALTLTRPSRVCGAVPRGGGAAAPSLALRGPGRPAEGAPRLAVVRPVAPVARRPEWLRRAAAGLAVALAAAALVIALGRLADGMAQVRAQPGVVAESATGVVAGAAGGDAAPVSAPELTVTVRAPGTVWDVVDAVAPGVSGPQRAAIVERVVTANALSSLRVSPGQVLRVPRQV